MCLQLLILLLTWHHRLSYPKIAEDITSVQAQKELRQIEMTQRNKVM